ncbi:MAG: iron-containing alcohol dehydrogenase [Paracoccaceae bacterium]|nr:iron-containing alcohol dehydrogenase [Paracoccaceae bacterium]
MTLIGNWSYPTQIKFGAGRIREIADACNQANIKRPLLITDKGLSNLPITSRTLQLMKEAGLGDALFSNVDPNPNEKNLESGITAFKEGSHDGVIAFGGGSGLDLGKLVAFMVGQDRSVWDFEDVSDWWSRANPNTIFPIVAIPTTAGTGSEVGRASVLTNSDTLEKKIIFHPQILPKVVICDPELTIGMPKSITAGTGLDAFAHCVEAFSSPHYHPMSQGIAVEGMRLVIENLGKVYSDGSDIEARANMMSAALMGATAFQKGLGAIHALSHPIGAIHHTHHGTTNAVCMPAVLRLNESKIRDRFDSVTGYLGIKNGFSGFKVFVDEFNASLNIPLRLCDLGVENPDLGKLVKGALSDPSCGGNPVKLTSENLKALFGEVL